MISNTSNYEFINYTANSTETANDLGSSRMRKIDEPDKAQKKLEQLNERRKRKTILNSARVWKKKKEEEKAFREAWGGRRKLDEQEFLATASGSGWSRQGHQTDQADTCDETGLADVSTSPDYVSDSGENAPMVSLCDDLPQSPENRCENISLRQEIRATTTGPIIASERSDLTRSDTSQPIAEDPTAARMRLAQTAFEKSKESFGKANEGSRYKFNDEY